LIFSKYVREGTVFTRSLKLRERAARLQQQTAALVFTDANLPVYMGRIGAGPAPSARSERLEVSQLIKR
jgi:hypothetical protein